MRTSKIVNPYFLHESLAPWTGLADDDEVWPQYREFDSNDEAAMRREIRDQIVPHLSGLPPAILERVRLAYRYYLSCERPGLRFDRVFDSLLPPFDAPRNPRDLFLWIWQECFPDEDYHLPDWSEYEEKPDIAEPLRLVSEN
jgi:hypothetical protein